jgi:hypothetical protein
LWKGGNREIFNKNAILETEIEREVKNPTDFKILGKALPWL